MYIYLFFVIIALLVAWSAVSYISISSIETPAYTVVSEENGYQIRTYSPHIVAETTVSGSLQQASSEGFRIIADYIFGNNTSNDKISMTAPVVEQTSEKIAMTAPVINTLEYSSTRTVSFILPSKYTMETLPMPNNSKVTLKEIPERTVAVLRFTWYPTARRIEQKKAELTALLERDNKNNIGAVQVARYNPPLSMPLLLRNEIIIPIDFN